MGFSLKNVLSVAANPLTLFPLAFRKEKKSGGPGAPPPIPYKEAPIAQPGAYDPSAFVNESTTAFNSAPTYSPMASPFSATQAGLFAKYRGQSVNKAILGARDYGAGVSRGQRLLSDEMANTASQNKATSLFNTRISTLRHEAQMAADERAAMAARRQQRAQMASQIGGGLGMAGGTAIGGPIGGAIGGALGSTIGGLFCFDACTPVLMADGKVQEIRKLVPGDKTAGGVITSVRVGFGNDLYLYKRRVFVTAYHAVNEDGKWLRIKDSKHAKFVDPTALVYSITTTDHRILVPAEYTNDHLEKVYDVADVLTFADEHETDNYESFDLDESLAFLNATEGVSHGK